MKTILDNHNELYLESLCEKDDLICRLLPMKLVKHRRKVPDSEGVKYEIKFQGVGDYLVLQEITHVSLGLNFTDDNHLTECTTSELSKVLQTQDIYSVSDIKHYVLRTAHCAVHVFTADNPIISEVK